MDDTRDRSVFGHWSAGRRPTPRELADSLFQMREESDRPHHSDFVAVSEAMMEGYARFIELGLARHTIALAMLGGAINLYEMFDMRSDLPDILRAVADRLDGEPADPH